MGRWACARLLERRVRASSCFDKIGALFLIAPLVTSLMRRSLSFSSLAEFYSEYTDTPQLSFMPTPAYVFVLCIVILVAITITSRPSKRRMVVPSHVLQLPFEPLQVATFTSPQCHVFDEAPAVLTRGMPKSSSYPCLSSHHELHMVQNEKAPTKAGTTSLVRSPSHDTFLTGKPLHPGRSAATSAIATESLSDEEVNRRFGAFIESRFAAMKREMTESGAV